MLDHPGVVAEFLALDRRVARGGRESIDHPRGGRDDMANAAAEAIVAAARPPPGVILLTGPAPSGPAALYRHRPNVRLNATKSLWLRAS